MEQARRIDTSMATVWQRPWITRGDRGLDFCWDTGGIPRYIMDLVSDGVSKVVDMETNRAHAFRSPSDARVALVIGRINRTMDRHTMSCNGMLDIRGVIRGSTYFY